VRPKDSSDTKRGTTEPHETKEDAMRFKLGVVMGGAIGFLIASGKARELLDEARAGIRGGRRGAKHTVETSKEPSESTPWPSHVGDGPLAPVT
jgi:hypothetical protein